MSSRIAPYLIPSSPIYNSSPSPVSLLSIGANLISLIHNG